MSCNVTLRKRVRNYVTETPLFLSNSTVQTIYNVDVRMFWKCYIDKILQIITQKLQFHAIRYTITGNKELLCLLYTLPDNIV